MFLHVREMILVLMLMSAAGVLVGTLTWPVHACRQLQNLKEE